jgi:hypothetical protein
MSLRLLGRKSRVQRRDVPKLPRDQICDPGRRPGPAAGLGRRACSPARVVRPSGAAVRPSCVTAGRGAGHSAGMDLPALELPGMALSR